MAKLRGQRRLVRLLQADGKASQIITHFNKDMQKSICKNVEP